MNKLILIDPGHGGNDSGAVASTGQREDRTNLNVALYLQQMLRSAGYQVDMTRTKHEEIVSLNTRMAMIRAKPYDLVVSIHHNGGGGDGSEICVQVDNRKKAYDDKSLKLAGFILDEFKKLGQNLRINPIIRKLNSSGNVDYFGVLRAAAGKGIPAVITELAFVDSKDVCIVDTYADQKAEVMAIATAVKKYD